MNKEKIMRHSGNKLSQIIYEVGNNLKVGMSTLYIDSIIDAKLKEHGLKPAIKNYCGYQHCSCISVNDVAIHGVPSDEVVIKASDVVKIDVVALYRGLHVDMSRTFLVEPIYPFIKKIFDQTQLALDNAINIVKEGVDTSLIGLEIQKTIEGSGFFIVKEYCGHGISKNIHEKPTIYNYYTEKDSVKLKKGDTFTIEPIVTFNGPGVYVCNKDKWSVKTISKQPAIHIEDTVIVGKKGCEILTRSSK